METYARIENKLTGEILWQNTAVLEVGDRNATQYTTYPYQADYQIVLYAIDSNSKMANLTDMKAYINEKHPLISKPDNVPAIVSGGSVINNGTVGAEDDSGQMRLVVKPVDDLDPAKLVGRKLVARW